MENLKVNKPNSSVLISALLFVLFASLSVIFYFVTANSSAENSLSIFNGEVSRIDKELSEHLIFYRNILSSMRGLFVASQSVEREEFRNFIKDIAISEDYSPVSSFLYIERVRKDDLQKFNKEIESDKSISSFSSYLAPVASEVGRNEYYLVKYSEPTNDANIGLLESDILKAYPETVKAAIDNNEPTATGIFINPYFNKNEIIVILPVYANQLPSGTVEDREKNIKGFVGLAFKTKDLLDDMFFPGSANRLVATNVFSGDTTDSQSLIYSNSSYPSDYKSKHIVSKTMLVGEKYWTIEHASTPGFDESIDHQNISIILLLSGFAVSLLISLVTYSVLNSRNRAIKMAEGMTKDLGESEKKLRNLNRALLTIGEANQIIVKTKNEEKLLQSVCNILVKNAGYCLAWVGYAEDDEEKTVRVVSWAGHSDGYIEKLKISWSENNPRGMGPTGRAIREKRIIITPDFSADERFAPWRADAESRGYKGSIVLPLISDTKFMGAINIYSSEKDIFGEEEVKMLKELADDLAFSISSIRTAHEKEKAEAELISSEEKFSKVFKTSPYAITITRIKDGSFVDVNEAFIRLTGYTKEEALASSSVNLALWANPEDRKNMIASIIKGEDVKNREFKFRRKDGEVLTGLFSAQVIHINEEPTILSSINDISDRKEAEEKLKESEELLSRYMLNSPIYTFIKEVSSSGEIRVLRASSNYSEMIGEAGKNMVGKTMYELFPADFAKKMVADDLAVMSSGKVLKLEETLNGKNYTTIKFPIILGDKKLLAGYTIDITEQKKAEADLAIKMNELQQFRLAVDNASDHIIITDPNAKIIYANRGVEKITGYSPSELIGKTPAVWGHQMPKDFYQKMWHTIKVDKQPFIGELTNRKKNGQLYQAEFSISPIFNDTGDIIYFVGVERDITQAKEIEKSKNEFVSLASHQLRTPLTAINWYAEMLLAGDAGAMNAKQKDYVGELASSSRRMTDLVSALLNVSRIDLGTFTINPTPTDIVKISKAVIKDLCVKIDKKKLKITEKYEKLPEIKADPNLITIILQNLLSNSVKYTPELGTIKVSIGEEGEDVVMKVEDNGYGIPLHQQNRIFDKFFRADNIVPVETDGNGLGLYMVKQILNNVGGSITFTSAEGVGTTFIVKIPRSGMREREGSRILEQKGFGI